MKKIFFIVAVLFCFAAVSYKAFFYFDKRIESGSVTEYRAVARLKAADLQKLREGDFILRRGFGIFSDMISENLNKGNSIDVTHAGILVKRDGNWCVIHSLSSDVTDIDGVQLQPLDTFLTYSVPDKIIVTRAKGADTAVGKKIAALAGDYLKKQVPFDHTGDFKNTDKLFCTELIWHILEKDLDVVSLPRVYSSRKKVFYSMAPMYSKEYFDIIINQYEKEGNTANVAE